MYQCNGAMRIVHLYECITLEWELQSGMIVLLYTCIKCRIGLIVMCIGMIVHNLQ